MSERVMRVCVAMLCAVAGGIFVAMLHSQSAEFYPAFSSLRSDERGTMILYESLERSGARNVSRSFVPLDQLRATDAVILLIGVASFGPELRTESLINRLEDLASRGNRVVLSVDTPSLVLDFMKSPGKPLARRGVIFRWTPSGKPQSLDQRSAPPQLSFEANDNWRILRRDDIGPRAIERAYNNGSLVLVANSDAFLNRTLARSPDSAYLLSLLGSSRNVLFSESHLGVVETGTILGLARRYHLQGLLFGLVLLASVFLWRNLLSFPPRRPDESAGPLSATDSFTAFARLLEKSLPSSQILNYCVEARVQVEPAGAKRRAIQSAFEESRSEKDTIRRFHFLQESLHRKPNLK